MNRESAQGLGSSGLLWIWFFVVVIPIYYVLSIGPVGAIAKKGPNASWVVTARKFYYPVIWLGDHTPFKKPIEAYFRLWV